MVATIVEYRRGVANGLFDLTEARVVTGGGRGLGRGMAEALAGGGDGGARRSLRAGRGRRAELGGVAVRADLAARRHSSGPSALLGGLDVLVTAHGTTRSPAPTSTLPPGTMCSRRT